MEHTTHHIDTPQSNTNKSGLEGMTGTRHPPGRGHTLRRFATRADVTGAIQSAFTNMTRIFWTESTVACSFSPILCHFPAFIWLFTTAFTPPCSLLPVFPNIYPQHFPSTMYILSLRCLRCRRRQDSQAFHSAMHGSDTTHVEEGHQPNKRVGREK